MYGIRKIFSNDDTPRKAKENAKRSQEAYVNHIKNTAWRIINSAVETGARGTTLRVGLEINEEMIRELQQMGYKCIISNDLSNEYYICWDVKEV